MAFRLEQWSAVAMLGVAVSCASTGSAPGATAQGPDPAVVATLGTVISQPKKSIFPVIIGTAPVSIDGDLSDWPRLPIGRVATKDGAHACNFRVFVDATRVYGAFEVTDATPVVNREGKGRNWRGDAIELFLGTHASRRDRLGEGDVQVIVSYNPQAPLAWNYYSHEPMNDAQVVVKDVPGGWLVEASFTLAELGLVAPEPGAPVWIDFALDNSDGSGRNGQYPWHGNLDLYKTPSMWKRSSFVPQP